MGIRVGKRDLLTAFLWAQVQVLLQHKGKIKGTLPPEGFSLPTTAMAPFTPPRPM